MPLPDLGKQVGPLPLGAWVVVVGGSLGFMIYSRSHGGGGGSSDMVAQPVDTYSGVGMGGVGAVGAYTPTGGGVESPASPTAAIVSNTQWGQTAFAWLVSQGLDGSTVDVAIRNYLMGKPLTVQQNGIITQALARYGQVPEFLPDAPNLPTVPKATPKPAPRKVTPAPKPAKKPVSHPVVRVLPQPAPRRKPAAKPAARPPVARTYTVVRGDSLWKIASRFYGTGTKWSRIYNANRATIGGNPSLIRPGQVLTIPA